MAAQTQINPDPRWQFFPAKKRQVILESWTPKKNTEDEKRVLLKFKMPITGQDFQGFPEFLSEGFNAVEKERSGGTFESDTNLEQMALDYYDTDKSVDKVQRASGVTLQGFTLSREKDGESYVTVLRYHYNVPWWRGIWKFLDVYWGMTLWCDFVPSPDYVPQQDEKNTGQMNLGEKTEEIPHQTPERARAVAEEEEEEAATVN